MATRISKNSTANGAKKAPAVVAPVRGAGRPPLDDSGENMKRLPVFLSDREKEKVSVIAGSRNSSAWVRDLVKRALRPMPIYGPVCCGDGIEAMALEETRTVVFIEDLLPTTQARKYLFPAQGDSMNNARDPRSDIQDNDLLICIERQDAENGQTVHFQWDDGYGGRICGVRYFRQEGNVVTLRASNDAINPISGDRMYPDIVLPRNEVDILGIWLRIKISGVRL